MSSISSSTKATKPDRSEKKSSEKTSARLSFLLPQLPTVDLGDGFPDKKELAKARHVLLVFPLTAKAEGVKDDDDTTQLPKNLPGRALLEAVLTRKNLKAGALRKMSQQVVTSDGALWSFVALTAGNSEQECGQQSRFEQQTLLRKAVMPLLNEKPEAMSIIVQGDGDGADWSGNAAENAAYVTLINCVPIQGPSVERAKKNEKDAEKLRKLKALTIYGVTGANEEKLTEIGALAVGNLIARRLTALPPNALTPTSYRKLITHLADEMGWTCEVLDVGRLKKLGAGAFLAVAQGSPKEDAAIVHLTYQPPSTAKSPDLHQVALVGKGICFDTGGLNLKPARYMAGMHEDMSGSAVALASLFVASRLKMPLRIDAWLAIAENDLSPAAYKQGAIIEAVNGDSIEVVHTDAEGRMVLADTLALAVGNVTADTPYAQIVADPGKPGLVIDYATLTGSMVTALGTRYAGVFASRDDLALEAVEAGKKSGERVCVLPDDEDYAESLETPLADVKQCTLEGEADHILATCFLRRFVGNKPWLHVDLSTAACKGGLGAVSTDTTGFGVAWTLAFLQKRVKNFVAV